jgi:polysaccharide biosynthesis protein PslG
LLARYFEFHGEQQMNRAMTALIALCLSVVELHAADLPAPIVPYGVGMNTQWNDMTSQTIMNQFMGLGAGVMRTHAYWGNVEYGSPGNYYYGVEGSYGYDSLYSQTRSRGLRNFITLSLGSNDPTAYGADHTSATWQNAYAAFAGNFAGHYYSKGYTGNIYEICNEPQGDVTGIGIPSVYASLVQKAYTAIKAADPTAVVVAGSTWNINDWVMQNSEGYYWLGQCAANGMLNYCDAVSVHPYNSDNNPEMFVSRHASMRSAMLTNGGKVLPMVASEWGVHTYDRVINGQPGVSEQTQADYLPRYYMVNLSQGIPLSIAFDWQEDANNGWGVMDDTDPLTPKPAYDSIRKMTASLQGEAFKEKLSSNSSDWLLVFRNPTTGFETLAAWTTGDAHTVNVPGWGELSLSGTPIYINPVPEPGAIVLLGIGLTGILAYTWRKRRN